MVLQDCAWGHCKQWNHPQNHKKVENMVFNRLWEGHLFIAWELKQEGRVSPESDSAGNTVLSDSKCSPLCSRLQITAEALEYGCGVINFSDLANSQKWSTRIVRIYRSFFSWRRVSASLQLRLSLWLSLPRTPPAPASAEADAVFLLCSPWINVSVPSGRHPKSSEKKAIWPNLPFELIPFGSNIHPWSSLLWYQRGWWVCIGEKESHNTWLLQAWTWGS